MEFDGILFDLDGTLWDSVDAVVATWNQVIARHPGLRPPITRKEQESVMGLQMDDIARRFFPSLPHEARLALMQECMDSENDYLAEHGGVLYPRLREVLARLSERLPLFVVSNCQAGYIEAFLHAHGLGAYFTGHLCFGDTGESKAKNIRAVVERYGLKAPVYVGDTALDQASAREAGVPFIHAAYGFGEVDAPRKITCPADLLPLLED